MEAIKQKSRLEQWTLLLAAILCAAELVMLIGNFSVVRLLWVAVFGFLCWLLFTDRKAELFGDAFLAMAAVGILAFFLGFSQGKYVVLCGDRAAANFFSVLPGLLVLLGVLSTAALGLLRYAGKFPAIGEKLKEAWFVPALLFAVTLVYSLLLIAIVWLVGGSWPGVRAFVNLETVLWGLFALALGMGVSGRESLPLRSGPDEAAEAPALRYISMAKLLLLTCITLGIWGFVWIYRTTAALRAYEDRRPRKALHELLFCLLLPFYGIYWSYKSAQLVEKAEGEKSRFDVLCLVMAVLLPPVAMILLQDKINGLADAAGDDALTLVPEAEPVPDGAEAEDEAPEAEPAIEAAPETEAEPETEPEPEAEPEATSEEDAKTE